MLAALAVGADGLSETEAARRAAQVGPNRMPAARPHSPARAFLRQFNNALIYVLLARAAVTALLGHWADSAVIIEKQIRLRL